MDSSIVDCEDEDEEDEEDEEDDEDDGEEAEEAEEVLVEEEEAAKDATSLFNGGN